MTTFGAIYQEGVTPEKEANWYQTLLLVAVDAFDVLVFAASTSPIHPLR